MELRQMAQCSAQESQLHMATLFHFLISNRGAGRELPDAFPTLVEAVAVAAAESSISMSSTMVAGCESVAVCCFHEKLAVKWREAGELF